MSPSRSDSTSSPGPPPEPHANHPSGDTSRVGGNAFFLGAGEIVARAIGLLATGYLTRVLGADGFGLVGWAIAVCGYLSFAVYGGFDELGTREIARRRREDAVALALGATALRVLVAAALALVMAGIAQVVDRPTTARLVLVATSASFLSMALDSGWVFKGLENGRRIGAALVGRQLLYAALVLLVVRDAGDVVLAPLCVFASEAVAAVWLAVPLLRGPLAPVDWASSRALFRSSAPIVVIKLCRHTMVSFDILLIELLMTSRHVGLYAASWRFCQMLVMLSVTIHSAYRPVMARAALAHDRTLGSITGRAHRMAAAVGIPLCAGAMVVAEPLLVLLFGPEYRDATGTFRLLLASPALYFLTGNVLNVLVVTDRLRSYMVVILAGTALNLAGNAVLIPRLGMEGAALATVGAQSLILAGSLLIARRLGVRAGLAPALRPALAGAAMIGLLLALGWHDRILLPILVGGAVYIAALGAVRGWPEDLRLPGTSSPPSNPA